jgi:ribonuclease R
LKKRVRAVRTGYKYNMEREIMLEIKDKIIQALKASRGMQDFDALTRGMEEKPAELRQAVQELIAEGRVLRSAKGKLFLPGTNGFFTGRLEVKRQGFAFLLHEAGDIFIPSDSKGGAMDGDLVVVRLLSAAESDRKREGEVTQILEEKRHVIVGVLSGKFVLPDDERLDDIYIAKKGSGGARNGQKVVVELKRRAKGGHSAEGRVTEVLGAAGAGPVEMKSIIRRLELPEAFPQEVEQEAAAVAAYKPNLKKREDYRDQTIITIDGADAKDLDDAVSVKKLEDGYELGVHIADVADYVKAGSKLDKEALKRGTSVYLADMVIPMLPHALSNGACSLNEGQDKLTLSCVMKVDAKGRVTDSHIAESVICSRHRMTYSGVNAIFAGDTALTRKYADIYDNLMLMKQLAEVLRERREEKGSIDFELEEAAFTYGADGRVTEVGARERGDAERLIEEFMLTANKTVAETYFLRELPFVYRVHDQPDNEKMNTFAMFYANFGRIHGTLEDAHPKKLQAILHEIKGTPHENIVSEVLLRSMKKAEYSPECKGHFGLSFKFYCHFTSPIRRYPDLMVHRIIKDDLAGRMTPKHVAALEAIVEQASRQSSVRERAAMEAERLVDDVKKAEYMQGREGEVYDGVVSGVSRNVIFVQLDNTVEGVIPLSSLQDDYYVWMEKQYCVIGERTRRKISLGDEMRIRVENVNVYPPRIEFAPAR